MTLRKKEKTVAVRIAPADESLPAVIYCLTEEKREGRAAYSILCRGKCTEEDPCLWVRETEVHDVTSVEEEGLRLLDLLCRCRVTPYGLREAVEAWLA